LSSLARTDFGHVFVSFFCKDVGETKMEEDIYDSFVKNCIEAQKAPIFQPVVGSASFFLLVSRDASSSTLGCGNIVFIVVLGHVHVDR